MSEISKELQEQQMKDAGAAMKKIFGDIPVIDAAAINEEERKRLERDAIARLNKQIDALKP